MALIVTGCTAVDPVVKIGLVGPFEGRNRHVGYDVIYSARLAVHLVNNAGGIGRYRVGLVALDDFGEPDIAIQTAQSLVVDPGVVAVIGHWLPITTQVADPVYAEVGLPFVPAGTDPFGIIEPSQLSEDFRLAYESITPFDETPGPYAGSAYEATNLVLEAMKIAEYEDGFIDRESMARALESIIEEGNKGNKAK